MYSWDDKEAECYRLYVEEKRSLDEVITIFQSRGFTPSKRAFQTQFKRWDFPSKQNPAHKNPALVARLRELWEENYSQKDMVDTLQSEGFPINDRELIRLRLRLKLLLRESVPRPKRKQSTDGDTQKAMKRRRLKTIEGKGLNSQLGNATLAEDSSSEGSEGDAQSAQEQVQAVSARSDQDVVSEAESAPLTAEETLRKQLRLEQLQHESDEKWRTRKRRRRTRGWAGLPADTPGEPPRFPSETTIDEAKAYLGLDNKMYREIRERFLEICKDEDIVKKTAAGPEKWASVVQKLINENPHLSTAFEEEPEVLQGHDALFRPKGQKALSIDVICMDVTKRLRTMDTRMTLADVKNILRLNPEQTRSVRSAFASKLREDHFTNKHEAGEQHWADLKTAWVNESELLARVLAQGEPDPEYERKLKAIEVLARDVMKRQQQEKTMKDPSRKKQVHQGPGPGPAPPVIVQQSTIRRTKSLPGSGESPTVTSSQTDHSNLIALAESADLQIDPSLLLAASDAAVLPVTDYGSSQHYHSQDHYQQSQPSSSYQQSQPNYPSHNSTYYQASSTTASVPTTAASAQGMPLPIYYRLHPHSSTPFPTKTMWLSILQQPTIAEIRSLAVREHPSTQVTKLEGLITYRGRNGEREVSIEVGTDDELVAYLEHVQSGVGNESGERQGKATFVVMLSTGGSGEYVQQH